MKPKAEYIFFVLILLTFSNCIYADMPPYTSICSYDMKNFGIKGDGQTMNTDSINYLIDLCSSAGGGTVFFPSGVYLTGTVYLKSNVRIYLDAGAVILGSKQLMDYPETIPEIRSYTDNYTDKSLFYGEGLENISITGKGVINGNGTYFDPEGSYKERPFLIRLVNCSNISIEDVQMTNAAMWMIHMLVCRNIKVDGLNLTSQLNYEFGNEYIGGDNNDGLDIDGCSNVRISNCCIKTGDDAIVLKSTLDRSCSNVTITNCVLSSSASAFKMGTESNGGYENIVFSNSVIYDTRGAGIALLVVDGGVLDRVSITNIIMNHVGKAIFIRLGNRARPYKEGITKPSPGELRNVMISNVQGTNIGKIGCSITGLPYSKAQGIHLNDIFLSFRGGGTKADANRAIPERAEAYPGITMFGTLPAYGFYCRHVEDLHFRNISLDYAAHEERYAFYLDDIKGLLLENVSGNPGFGRAFFRLDRVIDASIMHCSAREEMRNLLEITNSEKVRLHGNDAGNSETEISPLSDKSQIRFD